MKQKKTQKQRRWSGLWFEPGTEHISSFQEWHTYRRLTGFARQYLGLSPRPTHPQPARR